MHPVNFLHAHPIRHILKPSTGQRVKGIGI
nr:MAG TPA: hypothetical protein [Bacteriophage sp.]